MHQYASPEAPAASGINNVATLPVDAFAVVAEGMVAERKIDAAGAERLTRFLAESRRRRLSAGAMGEAMGVSATTVSRVFRGLYEGDVAAMAERAALALRLWSERGGQSRFLVETSVSKKIFAACNFALTRQTPVVVTGVSQMGKTTALEEFARRSDAVVRMVRIPAAASLQLFLEVVAEAMGIPVSLNVHDRRRRILRALNDRTLLIIDELHELTISASRAQARRICEVLREFYDVTRCGLVLCGTELLETDLLHGPDAGLLDQIVRRAIATRLPRRVPLADALAVAAANGLTAEIPDDAKIELRPLYLNHIALISSMAAEAAKKRGLPLDWSLWLATKTALLGE